MNFSLGRRRAERSLDAGAPNVATRSASPRPELTVTIGSSRIPTRIAYGAIIFAVGMLFVPTAQLAWGWKLAIVALAALSWVEARKLTQNVPEAVRIAPDDQMELRRRYEGGHFYEFERVEPFAPLFVSPLAITFQTHQHTRVVLFADQVAPDDWRNLRVRLNHLRTLKA